MEGLLIRLGATVYPRDVSELWFTVRSHSFLKSLKARLRERIARVRGSDQMGLKIPLIKGALRGVGTKTCSEGCDLTRRVNDLKRRVIDRAKEGALAAAEVDDRRLLLTGKKIPAIEAL